MPAIADTLTMTTADSFVEIELGYPPTLNMYWRHVGHKVLISEEGRRYRRDVCDRVLVSKIRRPIAGPLKMTIVVFPPDNRRRDIDNLPKSILDALQRAGLYNDDYHINDLRIVRGPVRKDDPCAMVYLEKLDPNAQAPTK